ncbi:hypothetical protein HNQ36_001080 [Afipia massiliensis]|uniref:Uncharacterized protein n=1 Tax=Afipia massiliensis TaxID=211460 RepID=A0A840N318_9BRAD|nr:hypothetical protein [Afipia massiliensis]MBB5051126.1 hypothetical protein [Afipia massiliensis]
MTIDTGGAAASADPIDVSGSDQVVTPPNPISTEREPAAPAADKSKPVTLDDALDRAIAKVDEDEKAGKDAPKPIKSEQPRDNGKFAGKDPKDAPAKDAKDVKDPAAKPAAAEPAVKPGDQPGAKPAATDKPAAVDPAAKPAASTSPAPARFSADAKAVWDTAPEPVKAEVARMERELTAGIEKHRVAAERDSKIAPFHQMAEESGTDVHTALTKYTNLEKLLRTNPLKGIEAVCENIGVSLKEVAQIVLGQTPDQERSQQEATIRDLRATVQRLEQSVTGITKNTEQQHVKAIETHIGEWAESRPYFEAIAPHIANEMREGAANLDDAEARVFQKFPALASLKTTATKADKDPPAASSAAANAEELAAQTRKGSLSITSSPSAGSDPAPKKNSKSIDEAIDRAFAAAG